MNDLGIFLLYSHMALLGHFANVANVTQRLTGKVQENVQSNIRGHWRSHIQPLTENFREKVRTTVCLKAAQLESA